MVKLGKALVFVGILLCVAALIGMAAMRTAYDMAWIAREVYMCPWQGFVMVPAMISVAIGFAITALFDRA